jgi:hypothetical protein
MTLKRSDFIWWGVGLISLYLSIAGSINEPSTWQGVVGLVLLACFGVLCLQMPWHIDSTIELAIAEHENRKPDSTKGVK